MPVQAYKGTMPDIAGTAYIAETAVVIGDVRIGPDSGIWPGCILRGDVNDIKIGSRTNIQDASVIHVSSTLQGTYIGDGVTVGHMALLHACTIGDKAFIGMKACVMDGAIVEEEAMLGAGSLVPPGKVVGKHELWIGSPARFKRKLTKEEIEFLDESAERYVRLSKHYMQL